MQPTLPNEISSSQGEILGFSSGSSGSIGGRLHHGLDSMSNSVGNGMRDIGNGIHAEFNRANNGASSHSNNSGGASSQSGGCIGHGGDNSVTLFIVMFIS